MEKYTGQFAFKLDVLIKRSTAINGSDVAVGCRSAHHIARGRGGGVHLVPASRFGCAFLVSLQDTSPMRCLAVCRGALFAFGLCFFVHLVWQYPTLQSDVSEGQQGGTTASEIPSTLQSEVCEGRQLGGTTASEIPPTLQSDVCDGRVSTFASGQYDWIGRQLGAASPARG